jgi:hypothetical protein
MPRPTPEPDDPRTAALRRLERNAVTTTPGALAAHLVGRRSDLVDAFLAAGVIPDAREASPPRRTALMIALANAEIGAAPLLLDG